MAIYQTALESILEDGRRERERFDAELSRALQNSDFLKAYRLRQSLAPSAAKGERREEFLAAEAACADFSAKLGVRGLGHRCPVCRDTGFKDGSPCCCLRQRINDIVADSALSALSPERFEDAKYGLFGEDKRKFFEKVYAEAIQLSKAPGSLPQKIFVYCGRTGTGKSHLLKCLVSGLKENRKTVLALSSFGFFDLLSSLYKNEDRRVIMSALSESDVLAVDDLGCEACGDYAKNVFVSLLSARIEKGLLTVFTTNLEPADLQKVYGERILSRFLDKSKSKIYRFEGKDARLSR